MTAPEGSSASPPGPRGSALDLAPPTLRACVDLWVEVGTPISIGVAASGERRVVPIVGGRAVGLGTGPGGAWQARVAAGGADFQVLRADGVSVLEARYVLVLEGGESLYVENSGVRSGPPEAMERLRLGQPVDPAAIYFRCTPRFETASPRLAWMTGRLFVGVGVRHPALVAMRFFEVG